MSELGKKIVDKALQYKGRLTYVFGSDDIEGGTGDCSAYTQYIYNSFGIDIGPNTQYQYHKGESVARENLNYGDLVFFKNTYQSGHDDGVSHVGIYIGGDQFINLNSGGCVIDSLNNSYWSAHYLGARRVIQQEDGDHVESLKPVISTQTNSNTSGFKGALKSWGVDKVTDIVVVIVTILVMALGVGFTALSVLQAIE